MLSRSHKSNGRDLCAVEISAQLHGTIEETYANTVKREPSRDIISIEIDVQCYMLARVYLLYRGVPWRILMMRM
jgi:hypothetical protein